MSGVESQIDIVQANMRRLRITKALYGVLNDKRLCLNITEDLQNMVDQQFGGNYLYIPEEIILVPFLAVDPAPGRGDKKLVIHYEFVGTITLFFHLQHVETFTGKVVEKNKQTVVPGEPLILFQSS